jgi:hypothetical protein
MEMTQGVREVQLALKARDEAQRRFEAALGTSTEIRAYMRLRAATRRLAACDHEVRKPAMELERELEIA